MTIPYFIIINNKDCNWILINEESFESDWLLIYPQADQVIGDLGSSRTRTTKRLTPNPYYLLLCEVFFLFIVFFIFGEFIKKCDCKRTWKDIAVLHSLTWCYAKQNDRL